MKPNYLSNWVSMAYLPLLLLLSGSAFSQAAEENYEGSTLNYHQYSGNAGLDWWLDHGYWLSLVLISVGAVFFIGTVFRKLLISDPKEKYDYINGPQKKSYLYSAYTVNIAFFFFMTTVVLGGKFIWIYYIAQVLVSGVFVGMLHFALKFTFQFYYPTLVERKLKKLRYKPRKASNGAIMELLSEDEEDDYLDEGMQAEEEAMAIDYDVWIDRASGELKIEKYDGYAHALKCPNCKYQTYKLIKEELISKPTHRRSGKAYKYYACTYCGHKGKRAHTLHPTHHVKTADQIHQEEDHGDLSDHKEEPHA